jgi:hypothetical protein
MRMAGGGERVFGAALVGVGLLALFTARNLPFGTLREPGAGFFPLTVAALLILFAALSIFGGDSGTREPPVERGGAIRVSILAVLLLAYAVFLPSVGFVLCTTVLLTTVMGGLGRVGWLRAVAVAAVGAAGCYLLFTRLGMPLPRGLLGF